MLRWYQREGLGPPEEGTPARGNYAPEVTPLTVAVPTLVIYPDADIYTRPAAHEGLDRYVPDLDFQVVEGALALGRRGAAGTRQSGRFGSFLGAHSGEQIG